jgi:hypothetical protein
LSGVITNHEDYFFDGQGLALKIFACDLTPDQLDALRGAIESWLESIIGEQGSKVAGFSLPDFAVK